MRFVTNVVSFELDVLFYETSFKNKNVAEQKHALLTKQSIVIEQKNIFAIFASFMKYGNLQRTEIDDMKVTKYRRLKQKNARADNGTVFNIFNN